MFIYTQQLQVGAAGPDTLPWCGFCEEFSLSCPHSMLSSNYLMLEVCAGNDGLHSVQQSLQIPGYF